MDSKINVDWYGGGDRGFVRIWEIEKLGTARPRRCFEDVGEDGFIHGDISIEDDPVDQVIVEVGSDEAFTVDADFCQKIVITCEELH